MVDRECRLLGFIADRMTSELPRYVPIHENRCVQYSRSSSYTSDYYSEDETYYCITTPEAYAEDISFAARLVSSGGRDPSIDRFFAVSFDNINVKER